MKNVTQKAFHGELTGDCENTRKSENHAKIDIADAISRIREIRDIRVRKKIGNNIEVDLS